VLSADKENDGKSDKGSELRNGPTAGVGCPFPTMRSGTQQREEGGLRAGRGLRGAPIEQLHQCIDGRPKGRRGAQRSLGLGHKVGSRVCDVLRNNLGSTQSVVYLPKGSYAAARQVITASHGREPQVFLRPTSGELDIVTQRLQAFVSRAPNKLPA